MSETTTEATERDALKKDAVNAWVEIGQKQYQIACLEQQCVPLFEKLAEVNRKLVDLQKADLTGKGDVQ
jgi:uncharacterized coiled-coil DUF342 family protein